VRERGLQVPALVNSAIRPFGRPALTLLCVTADNLET
jgi:hypothetical protein